ncbi:hypothetical protein fugu_015177, partial [Takifugu bimaculatus]
GVRVQIHSQAEPPFVHELGFGVAPGFQTFVATQEQRLTYLPPPWGECEAKALGFFHVYSVTACRIDCETRYIVENCNCRMVHMPGDASYCTPEQYKDCAEPALAKLSAVENSNCMCRTPCNMTRYNKELSMVKIPSKTSARYLQKKFNKSEKYITDNILVLDVFFEALNYETIEQKKAYEVAGLLGDIGGQMGLFIGASILTILELFDYAYEVLKERLLDLLSREEEEESRGEDVSSCDPVANHSGVHQPHGDHPPADHAGHAGGDRLLRPLPPPRFPSEPRTSGGVRDSHMFCHGNPAGAGRGSGEGRERAPRSVTAPRPTPSWGLRSCRLDVLAPSVSLDRAERRSGPADAFRARRNTGAHLPAASVSVAAKQEVWRTLSNVHASVSRARW